MKFLVLGGTGNVGGHVVRELLARGHAVRVLTRDPAKAKGLGKVEVVKGDLLSVATVRTMYEGVDGAFILNVVSPSESTEGLMAVSAAMTARVPRLVYLSVQHADRAAHLPHFGSKVGIEAAIQRSGATWTILRPSNYHQNDVYFKDAMLQHGVYPQPLGRTGVSRVDVRDIGELAAIALTEDGHGGRIYEMGGPRPLTGEDCAAIWSKALGRPIAYAGDDLDAWEKQFKPYFHEVTLYDFRIMFDWFQKKGLIATEAEVATLTKALGHPPRSLEDYAAETAKAWAQEGAAARR